MGAPSWLTERAALIRTLAGSLAAVVASGVALGTIWTFADLPVPASRQWIEDRDAARARIGIIGDRIDRARKAVEALPPGEAQDDQLELIEQLGAERSTLCARFSAETRPAGCQ